MEVDRSGARGLEKLKAALYTTPVFAYPVSGAPYVLNIDASNTSIGAVLSQIGDGSNTCLDKPVGRSVKPSAVIKSPKRNCRRSSSLFVTLLIFI